MVDKLALKQGFFQVFPLLRNMILFFYHRDHVCTFSKLTLKDKFYIRGSVHRNSRLKKPNNMQQYADMFFLLNYSTCFGRPSRPSSGVYRTIAAASGTDHTIWAASFFKRDQIRTYLVTFEEACSPDSMICTRGCNNSFMYS